jgi:hypothetical protein
VCSSDLGGPVNVENTPFYSLFIHAGESRRFVSLARRVPPEAKLGADQPIALWSRLDRVGDMAGQSFRAGDPGKITSIKARQPTTRGEPGCAIRREMNLVDQVVRQSFEDSESFPGPLLKRSKPKINRRQLQTFQFGQVGPSVQNATRVQPRASAWNLGTDLAAVVKISSLARGKGLEVEESGGLSLPASRSALAGSLRREPVPFAGAGTISSPRPLIGCPRGASELLDLDLAEADRVIMASKAKVAFGSIFPGV